MSQLTSKNHFLSLIEQSLLSTEKGSVNKSANSLREIYSHCLNKPFELWTESSSLLKLSKVLMLSYHFELFDAEADNISVIELSYLYAYRAFLLEKNTGNPSDELFHSLRQLCLISNTAGETLEPQIADIISTQKGLNENDKESYRLNKILAGKIIQYIIYSFILEIEDTFGSFNDDAFLEQTCNEIELEHDNISDKLIANAIFVSQKLFLAIKEEYGNEG